MKTSSDTEMLIRKFLEQGINELPDRSYDVVRNAIEDTRQRAAFGPWRESLMSRFVVFATAAAALVLAVVIGTRFVPNPGVGVQPSPTTTPPTVPTSTPTEAPTTAPTAPIVENPIGRLRPGITYVAHPFDTLLGMDARPFTFTVPSDNWEAARGDSGNTFAATWNSGDGEAGGVGIGFLKVHSLNGDACHWVGTADDVAIGPTANDLLEALDGSPNVTLETDRSDVVTLTMPTTLAEDDVDCDETDYRIWNAEGFDIYAQGPSNIWLLTIDDFGGRYVILRSYMPDTPDKVINELDAIYRSITISDDHGCPKFSTSCN